MSKLLGDCLISPEAEVHYSVTHEVVGGDEGGLGVHAPLDGGLEPRGVLVVPEKRTRLARGVRRGETGGRVDPGG